MVIIGINGKMGNKVYEFFKNSYEIIGVDKFPHKFIKTYKTLFDIKKFDIVVDFSSPSAIDELYYAVELNKIVISGTTGYNDEVIQDLKSRSNKFYWSCNYAKGIEIFKNIINIIKPYYELKDFIEIHASTKLDAPSGTSKLLAKYLDVDENKIQSIRLPHATAKHEIIFTSNNERITIKHEIINYDAYLEGLKIKLEELIVCDKKII